MQLSFGQSLTSATIHEMHDPPLTGMEHDRVKRMESYVKAFKPLQMDALYLDAGEGFLTFKSNHLNGKQGAAIQMVFPERIE